MTDPFRQASTTTSPISSIPLEGTDLQGGLAGVFNSLGGDAAKGLLPANTPLQGSTDSFSKWTGDEGAPTGEEAKAAEDSGQETLTNVEAAPCADCPTNAAYSLAFQVKDANGKLCKGMYYTMKFKVSKKEPITGSLDDNGLTVRYFTDDPTEEIYLYIGKRTKDDGYPESQTTEEEKRDEVPLDHALVAPVSEKKIEPAATARLWKPWTVSDTEKDFLKNEIEEFRAHYYDLGDGGLTIGYGDFTSHTLGNGKPNPEIEALKEKYPPEGEGISEADADAQFEQNLERKAKASSWNNANGTNSVNVPLYQHEFDALVNMRYNNANTPYAGSGADPETKEAISGQTSVHSYLNRGRYTLAANRITTSYNTVKGKFHQGVTNRRNAEKKMFLEGVYEHW